MKVNEAALYELIGVRIKQQREAQDKTQDQLAAAVGVRRTSITNIEAGRQKLPLHLLYEICAELNTPIEILLPSITEVAHSIGEQVAIDALLEDVPVKTAASLKQMILQLEERNKTKVNDER